MSKNDFVQELITEAYSARNALTRSEDGKEYKALVETMKSVTKELTEKREALLKKEKK